MRVSVSLSRSCALRVSIFASLTRVWSAIRTVLVLESGIAPQRESIIPDFAVAWSKLVLWARPIARTHPAILASNPASRPCVIASRKSFELVVGRIEIRVALMDDFWRCALERFFGRNPRQPALLGKFFVGRKI